MILYICKGAQCVFIDRWWRNPFEKKKRNNEWGGEAN